MGWIYDLIKDSNLSPFQKECLVIADEKLIAAQRERVELQRALEELRIENLELWSQVLRLRQSNGPNDES